MKTTQAVTEAISPMAKKALYLSHFTPSMMPPETLQAMLVQRGPLLKRTVDSVVHSVKTTAKHHHLFVGPRGIGKTHLISLIHHQISQSPAVQSKALIAWMREEEWGVTSFMELILRILRTLDQTYPELGIDAQTQALYELSIAQAEEQATQILLQTLGDKTLVILLENLDDLFDQLKPTSQKQLRALIQNHPQFVLVATTPSLFTAVTSQNSPFYGFFDIDPLEELSFEEVVELLEKIALERGDNGLATFIQSTEGRARIRAVHHLAEGNPRIYIIFAQFLTQEALDELVQAFMHTLDELTPYYQARMKELSGQQRKIVEYLVHYRGAATVKQIAKSCFITQQVCSGQLKQLREKRTVRSIERGRESYYELTEPLMRLCMEVKQQKGEPIGLFVEMLRIWYTENQIKDRLAALDGKLGVDKWYLEAALEVVRKQKIEPPIKAIMADINKAATEPQKLALLVDLARIDTQNQEIKNWQSFIKLTFPKHCELDELMPEDFKNLSMDMVNLFERVMSGKFPSKLNMENELSAFFGVSAVLHKHSPKEAARLFQALGNGIIGFKAVAVRAIFKTMVSEPNADIAWLRGLLESLPEGGLSMMLKRLDKTVKSIAKTVMSPDPQEMLKLPREERRLVEEMLARYQKKAELL